jgi:predicted RNase H-like HicB family nuclease/DNA-binding XRE family transcriptional regulator
MKYHFKIHKDKNLLWAKCIELEGCVSQGKNLNELMANLKDSLDAYLFDPCNEIIFNFSDNNIQELKDIVAIEANPNLVLSNYLRYLRNKYHLTQEEASRKMGYKSTYGYQRLEKGTNNIKISTLAKLKKIFPEMSLDLLFS